MISASLTLAARATEVAVLRVRKSKSEGKSGSRIAKDSIESVYNNGAKIVGVSAATKPLTTSAAYVYKDIITYKVVLLTFKTFLNSPAPKYCAISYGFAAW